MAKEMLINVSEGEECRIALVEDGKLEELYMKVLGKAGPWPTGASRKVEHEERVAALDS